MNTKNYRNPPAFQFYAQDWMTGVMDLTMEERGVYITLLSIQWIKNEIPKKRLGFFIGMDWENVPEMVKQKFEDHGDYLVNNRLFAIADERKRFILKQRLNGLKGGRPKTQTKPKKTSLMKTEDRRLKKEDKRLKTEDVVYPYSDKKFIEIWQQWKLYKKQEFKFNYKSLQSEQAALAKLGNQTNNLDHAIDCIKDAMANGWKGFYPEKTNNNGKTSNTNTARYSEDFKREITEALQS